MRGTLDSRLKTFNTMPDNAKSARKAAATKKRGMLSARAWEDLRQASRLAHAQGVTLFMHGVKIVPQERYVSKGSTTPSKPRRKDAHDDRARRPQAAADGTRRRRSRPAVEATAAQRAAPPGSPGEAARRHRARTRACTLAVGRAPPMVSRTPLEFSIRKGSTKSCRPRLMLITAGGSAR